MRVKATNILNNKNRHDIVQLIYATEFVLPKISDLPHIIILWSWQPEK